MKKCNKDLKDAAVLEMLHREYPSSTYTWMPEFLAMANALPRRRYSPSFASTQEIPERADANGNLPPCGLSKPENWATLEIATRVVQAKLFSKTKVRYSLQAIRNRLKSK
jgi:hypothetical protein